MKHRAELAMSVALRHWPNRCVKLPVCCLKVHAVYRALLISVGVEICFQAYRNSMEYERHQTSAYQCSLRLVPDIKVVLSAILISHF